MSITVILSYDLPSALEANTEFKEALIAKEWKFEREGTTLPATTCIQTFKFAKNEEAALHLATDSVAAASKATSEKLNKKVDIERFLLLACTTPPALIVSGASSEYAHT
jgi:hypothetical protein